MTRQLADPRLNESGRRTHGAAALLVAVALLATAACQSSGPPQGESSSSQGENTVEPLDAAAVTAVKAETTALAAGVMAQLKTAGADVTSATGQWLTCDDIRLDFGRYSVAIRMGIAPAAPESQLDPIVTAMAADGWSEKRVTASGRKSPTEGNAVAEFRKGRALTTVTTNGSVNGLTSVFGDCVQSAVFTTEGFQFLVDKDTIPLG